MQVSGFTPRVSDALDLRQNLKICISDKFPSDTYAADLETTLGDVIYTSNPPFLF